MWQQIIRFKYLKNNSICSVKHKQNDSAIWVDLLKIKDIYLQGRKKVVKDDNSTLFWKDAWLYDKPLNILFPDLFKLCEKQNISIRQVKNDL